MGGATDETRVIIDGKLAEMRRDPRDVQVIVRTDTHGQYTVCLRDAGSVFVDAGTLEEGRTKLTGDSVDRGEREKRETLHPYNITMTVSSLISELRMQNSQPALWN